MITHKKRDQDLNNILHKQPYTVSIDGINLRVDKDVFPTDIAYASGYLGETIKKYSPRVALDMGCGTGFLALVLKRNGVPDVWASDHHAPAVRCAKYNATKNNLQPVNIIQSDLFTDFPERARFDLIVFNQAYAPPQNGVFFGCHNDGGRAIITRFFSQVRKHMSEDAAIIMPFSDMALKENDPKSIAQEFGFGVKTIFSKSDSGLNHYIYEIK